MAAPKLQAETTPQTQNSVLSAQGGQGARSINVQTTSMIKKEDLPTVNTPSEITTTPGENNGFTIRIPEVATIELTNPPESARLGFTTKVEIGQPTAVAGQERVSFKVTGSLGKVIDAGYIVYENGRATGYVAEMTDGRRLNPPSLVKFDNSQSQSNSTDQAASSLSRAQVNRILETNPNYEVKYSFQTENGRKFLLIQDKRPDPNDPKGLSPKFKLFEEISNVLREVEINRTEKGVPRCPCDEYQIEAEGLSIHTERDLWGNQTLRGTVTDRSFNMLDITEIPIKLEEATNQGQELRQQGKYGKIFSKTGDRLAGVEVRSKIYNGQGELDRNYVLDRIKFSIETGDNGRKVLGIRILANDTLLHSDGKTDIISLDRDGKGGLKLRVVNRDGTFQNVNINSNGKVTVGPPNQGAN